MNKLLAFVLLSVLFVIGAHSTSFNADYKARFLQMYQMIHNSSNGYFNADGVPYHSAETLICEAPDYGHLTTSEAYSYYIWLETMYGAITGNWDPLNKAYATLEKYAIPSHSRQPSNDAYNPSSPADFAPEGNHVSDYPATLNMNCAVGLDPIHDQLKNAYGTTDIYGTHWLFDADNWYEYGVQGDGTSRNGAINTFQRGPDEGVWKTVPQPEWETFKWGGPNGFLDLFTKQPPPYSQQWRYTNAPDADARIVQAMYWAYTFASQSNNQSQIPTAKASKLGDYLRYAMFDKYFKTIGSQTPCGSQSNWYGGFHGLISWYYAWGGYLNFQYPWGFRIGCEYSHFGYQNPLAAYTLSKVQPFQPKSSNGAQDWATSLDNQLNFYAYLQSNEGAIAGGVTSSWNGRYDPYPPNISTFNNMAYMSDPSYRDPPSNQWFGWQAWSMERVAEYYYVTSDPRASNIINKWLPWAKSVISINGSLVNGPGVLTWEGQPDPWTGSPSSNANLHVNVSGVTNDVGVMSSLAHAFTFIAAKNNDASTAQLAGKILDAIWSGRDDKGVTAIEPRPDYCPGGQYDDGFKQEVYIPSGWTGRNAQGAQIRSGMTFTDMRPKYPSDPMWNYVQDACQAGQVPQFEYHRFWAQSEFAVATADFARLFPNGV